MRELIESESIKTEVLCLHALDLPDRMHTLFQIGLRGRAQSLPRRLAYNNVRGCGGKRIDKPVGGPLVNKSALVSTAHC